MADHRQPVGRQRSGQLGEPLPEEYPVSSWQDCDEALAASAQASEQMRTLTGDQIAAFLDAFAARIEARKDDLVKIAILETALPASPRLADNELPRTTSQLRQAAAAARSLPSHRLQSRLAKNMAARRTRKASMSAEVR